MGRTSKLSPERWAEVDRRLAAGEMPSAIARDVGVSPATMTRRKISANPEIVQKVAQRLAAAQTELAELPVSQQYQAVSLAEKLRGMTRDLASAAAHGADTARRLKERANQETAKILAGTEIDVNRMSVVAGMERLANDSALLARGLIATGGQTVLQQVQLQEAGTPDKPEDGDAENNMTPTFNITLNG